jgi:Spy/CpxP family protein refolding chaperone
MMQMIKTGSGNRAQALALHREIAQQQGALMESRINFLYDLKEILTPEQFEKASQLMKQQAMEHRGAPGGPRPKQRPGSPGQSVGS